jgi:creatinine amidohydrolase
MGMEGRNMNKEVENEEKIVNRVRKIRWEEMFPDEFLISLESCPFCYCPYGLAEAHGAYNALGLDWLKAQALCERAAEKHGGIVMPPFAWHIQENPGFMYVWCRHMDLDWRNILSNSLSVDIFYHMLFYHIRALDARKFKAAILITGHYGGVEKDMRLLCDFYTYYSGSPIKIEAYADWEFIRYEGFMGDHAGVVETSQLMELKPELVDMKRVEKIEKGKRFDRWWGSRFPLSFSGKKNLYPSKMLGKNIVDSQINEIGVTQKRLLDSYVEKDGWEAPDINRIEEMWITFERLTRKYWIGSRTGSEFIKGNDEPSFPGWEGLGIKRGG